MKKLKATKSSLYKLVAEYEPMPSMGKTMFYKTPRTPSYFLEWSANGRKCQAYFSACIGAPILSVESKDIDTGECTRTTHKPSLDALRERGMLIETE